MAENVSATVPAVSGLAIRYYAMQESTLVVSTSRPRGIPLAASTTPARRRTASLRPKPSALCVPNAHQWVYPGDSYLGDGTAYCLRCFCEDVA